MLRHTYTTRLLYTAIPSECYAAKGATLQCLMQSLVDDVNNLYQSGIEVRSFKGPLDALNGETLFQTQEL